MQIDLFTLIVLNIILSFLMSVCLFAVSRSHFNDMKGIQHWSVALLLLGISWILIVLKGVIADPFLMVINSMFVSIGVACYFYALVAFKELSVPKKWVYFVLAFCFIGNVYFTYFHFNINAKIVVTSLTLAILLFASSAVLSTKQQEICPFSQRLTRNIFACTATVALVRAFYYGFWYSQPEDALLHTNSIQSIFFLFTTITIVGTSFGFVLMCMEKYLAEKNNAQELLQTAQKAAQMHNYVTDLQTGESTNSPELNVIYGVEPSFRINLESFKQILHSEDKEWLMNRYWQVVENREKYISVEYRTISPINNEVHWIAAWGINFYTPKGKPLKQIGMIQNITERKRMEEELRKNRDELLRYFQQPFIGMFTANHDKQIRHINQRFCDMVGYSMDEMQQLDWGKLTHPDDIAANQAYLEQAIRGEINAYQMEKRYIHKDGHIVYIDLNVECLRKADGSPDYFIGMMLDITERKAAEEEIKKLAFFDPLTNLPNRRKLFDRLQYVIALNHRNQSQFAVFMIDLDKFKAVNDKLGHSAGDELLKQVAARITHCLRDNDMVARLGGDEFVFVLENLNPPEVAETIALKVIADLTLPFQLSENNSVQIGASIGIGLYPQHGNTPESLMDHADSALYQAKDNGRGCFAYFSGNGLTLL